MDDHKIKYGISPGHARFSQMEDGWKKMEAGEELRVLSK